MKPGGNVLPGENPKVIGTDAITNANINQERRVMPFEETTVFATEKVKDFYGFGEPITVHPEQAAKLVRDGKATEVAPTDDDRKAAEARAKAAQQPAAPAAPVVTPAVGTEGGKK